MAFEVNSVPLSLTIIRGQPLVSMMRLSSRTTRGAVSELSATRARHSLVKSSTSVRMRKRRPLTSVSATKSSDQRRLRSCGTAIGARVPRARLRPPRFLLVEPIELLAIEPDALTLQHQTEATIAKPTPLGGKLSQPSAQLFIARPLCRIAVRLRMQAHEPTGPPLRVVLLSDRPGHSTLPQAGR